MPTHSMYTRLIDAALNEPDGSDGRTTTGGALAELLRCRQRMSSLRPSQARSGWAAAAVADQLAYDVALIRFAGLLGISWNLRQFDQPEHERRRLEQLLVSRGIHLDELDDQTDATVERPKRSNDA